MIKADRTTMYIKNKRDSCTIKGCSPFELYCKQKYYCFGIAYFSYTQRCENMKIMKKCITNHCTGFLLRCAPQKPVSSDVMSRMKRGFKGDK